MAKLSDNYPSVSKDCIPELAREVDALAGIFADGNYHLVNINANTIGLCANINTYAKSKSHLQRIEPVVIGISKSNWPVVAPFVFSDRPDFPFHEFPHINYEKDGLPPTLCLSRENIDDWYADHTLYDYVLLVAQWLRDAALGKLMKLTENDEFEPQRNHKIDLFLLRITYMDSFLERKEEPECHFYSITVLKDFPDIAYGNEQHEKLISNALGVRLFAGRETVDDNWYTQYPDSLGDLLDHIQAYGYPLNLNHLRNSCDETKEYIYFQLGLLRPAKIIGKNTALNYLCFRAKAGDVMAMNHSAPVEEVAMIDFTDYTQAKYLSKTLDSVFDKHLCILGCGAVGSKIASHLHRSGIFCLDLVDKDSLMPHNIVRHALSTYGPGSFLLNKAHVMKKSLSEMFYDMPHDGIKSYNQDALEHLSRRDLNALDIIIDATASVKVMHGLDATSFPANTRLVRVALSEGGDVGLSYLAVNNQQPFSDFYMEILSEAIKDDLIYRWLVSEKKNSNENIRVGEGCHSNTMRISDDTISAHAAIMSSLIRHIYEDTTQNRIVLSFANRDFQGSMSTCSLEVRPYRPFTCVNAPEWSVRIPDNLLNQIHIKARVGGKKENGGYLYGNIDHKRKIIYVLDNFMPRDSRGTPSSFRLGTSGLKEHERLVNQRTAGQMQYLGDWHSHPESSLDMSTIDMATSLSDVLPKLKSGIGLCVITKASDTRFHLIHPDSQ